MKAFFIALALALSSFTSNAAFYNLTVSGTVPWTSTGIVVGAGDQVTIAATGLVRYGAIPEQLTDANGGNYTGEQFMSLAVYPNTIIVSLIGKLGGTTTVGTGTPLPEGMPGRGAGFVGTSYQQIMLTGGELFLGFNDRLPVFDDNSGAFNVVVTVVPEPSIAALFGLGTLVLWRKWRSA